MKTYLLWIIQALFGVTPCLVAGLQLVTASVPGPRNISYLSIDLVPKIGMDRWAGRKS